VLLHEVGRTQTTQQHSGLVERRDGNIGVLPQREAGKWIHSHIVPAQEPHLAGARA
jgi:hypothetical protein